MKRAMAAIALLALLACSDPPPRPGPAGADERGWTQPPRIDAVQPTASGLSVRGQAAPGARVVLRAETGPAFAASADEAGRFDVRVAASSEHLLFSPEVRIGERAAPAPGLLLILAGGRGPTAVLEPGRPAQRLDAAGPLDAIDSDGRAWSASGRARPGAQVTLGTPGGSVQATAGRGGRWSVSVPGAPAAGEVSVGAARFAWPGPGPGGSDRLAVTRAGQGWRVDWPAQSTWLPDR
jgi:hypothetical protein